MRWIIRTKLDRLAPFLLDLVFLRAVASPDSVRNGLREGDPHATLADRRDSAGGIHCVESDTER